MFLLPVTRSSSNQLHISWFGVRLVGPSSSNIYIKWWDSHIGQNDPNLYDILVRSLCNQVLRDYKDICIVGCRSDLSWRERSTEFSECVQHSRQVCFLVPMVVPVLSLGSRVS